MPGISVSKICVPFGGGGIDWSSYWATLISATVENAAPTHVVLTFPSAASLGATDFTIAGFTIASGSWTGAILTLVLSDPVLVFHGNLTITFVPSGGTATVTNNVIDDTHTLAWWDRTIDERVTKSEAGAESIYWDWLYKKAQGAELATGPTVVNDVYEITATQTDFFYAGCQVGDVFICLTAKSLGPANKVKKFTGTHLVQGTAALQPINGLFDGSDDYMTTKYEAGWNRPMSVYAVIKQKTWTKNEYLWDGLLADNSFALYQRTSTPNIAVYNAGGTITANGNMPVDTWCIVRMSIDAEASIQSHLQVNDTTKTDSGAGTSQIRGFVLGAKGVAKNANGHIEVKEIIIRDQVDVADTQAYIYNYLNSKHELGLTPL